MSRFLPRGSPVRLCMVLACLLSLWGAVSSIKGEAKKENGMTFLPLAASENKEVKKEKESASLVATELPARSVDLSALNLTELVNGMLSRALKDGKKFFSLLSITSYSSFAFHKFSLAVYNISRLERVDPASFPTRYCYCLNNRTNDLSDFTALLVEIIGNSTSYLTEIFKSTSILSVRQTNESDCIFTCVMTGKAGRNLSDFWEMAEKSPVIDYTFTSSISSILGNAVGVGHKLAHPLNFLRNTGEEQVTLLPRGPPCLGNSQLCSQDSTEFREAVQPQYPKKKQCLCVAPQATTRAVAVRYCLEYYSWFLKNATYVCQRLSRVSHSHTLKQKCLENICKSV